MKIIKNPLPPIAILLICLFLFAGCAQESSTETPIAIDTASVTPEPTITATPTEVPTIPCTVAFDSDRDNNWEIYRTSPDGSNTVNLTNDPGEDRNPAWSPDGDQIAFVSDRINGDTGGRFIYVMNADGSNVHQLTVEDGSDFPNWSQDGSTITYTANNDIYIIRTDGSGESLNLTNSPEIDRLSVISPDGSKVAWLSGSDGNWNVFVMDVDGSNLSQITDNGRINNVKWTADGRIYVDSWGWNDQQEFCHNCVVDADGTNIVDAGGKGDLQRYSPFWTETGDRVELVQVDLEGNEEIYLIGSALPDTLGLGIGNLNLTNNPATDRNPSWPVNCGPGNDVAVEEIPQSSDPGEIVIGYEDEDNTMNDQQRMDLEKACSELPVQCVRGENIADLAAQNVDAILSFSSPWHVLGSSPQIHDAVTQGIPVFVLNAETDESEPGAYNLSIEDDTVRVSLKWMFQQMGGEGKFIYYNFGNSNYRQALIDQMLEAFPNIQATAMPADYENNPISVENISATVIADPDLGAIWTSENQNDVFWGLDDAWKKSQSDHLPLTVCSPRMDILQPWLESIEAGSPFKCISIVEPGGTAYEGVYVAYYVLSGMEINPDALGGDAGNTFLYEYPVITDENLAEWIAKADSFRVGQGETLELLPMSPEEIKAKWFLE